MRITVIGSADAFNSSGRSHSAYWLEGQGAGPIMVDFGATLLMRLRHLGLAAENLEGIAITHLHGDHIGGLPFLVIDGLYNARRSTPLTIVGPVGTRARLVELLEVTYGKAALLEWFPHTLTEIAPGESASIGGLRVEGFAAEHMDPPEQPLCLRITDASGRAVAFSGDTELCDGLFKASEGAELLIAECTSLAPPAGRHSTWEGWREAFPRVRSRRLMLTHLGADVRSAIPRLFTEAPATPPLSFAEDGLVLEI
ncbi:MAG: MBL fold metallo-hydrolase [Myxococcota bacterium]